MNKTRTLLTTIGLCLALIPLVAGATLFESNWSTATGTDLTALRDGDIWPGHLCQGIANALTVVEGEALGWTATPNVLRVIDGGSSICGTLINEPGLPLSTSHWGRLYFRDDEPTGVNNHFATYNAGAGAPIQVAHWNRQGTPEGTRIFIRTYYTTAGASTGGTGIGTWSLATTLPRGQWYRYEWHFEYVTPTTYRIWPRVYDASGNLVGDASDFRQSGYMEGPLATGWASWNGRNDWTLQSFNEAGHSFGFTDVNLARNIGFGQEGTAGYEVGSGEYFYMAAVKYDDSGWIGPAQGPAPQTQTVLFESNWSTATGNDINTAILDGGIWNNYWCQGIVNVLRVVEGTTVGWTGTPNVLRVTDAGTACGMLGREPGLPLSTSHYGRFFFHNDETQSTNNHFATYHAVGRIQLAHWNRQGYADGVGIFMRNYYRSDGTDNTYPVARWGIADRLNNGQWYRYEWHMEYVTPTSYRIWPRIYDMSGNLLYDAYDYQQGDYGAAQWNGRDDWTLGSYYDAGYTFGFSDINFARNIGFGQEGPAGSLNSGEYFYFAALKYVLEDWVGGIDGAVEEPLPDTTPPTATITAPTAAQVFAAGTTQTTLSVTTNEAATCRYSTNGAHTYAQMTNTMTGAGSTSHTATLAGLTNGASYTYYVRCSDSAQNNMTSSISRTFSVATPPQGDAPVITVSSTYTGYTTTPINDNIITAAGGASTTWASGESAVNPHWIELTFPTPVALSSATLHWAYNGGTYRTSREVHVQRWDGSTWQTLSTISESTSVASSTTSFTSTNTTRYRLLQPANQGHAGYSVVMWITELDYTLGTGTARRIGDLNNDGVINLQDVILIVANFRRRGNYDEGADINSDGTVNVLDMVLLARQWS